MSYRLLQVNKCKTRGRLVTLTLYHALAHAILHAACFSEKEEEGGNKNDSGFCESKDKLLLITHTVEHTHWLSFMSRYATFAPSFISS